MTTKKYKKKIIRLPVKPSSNKKEHDKRMFRLYRILAKLNNQEVVTTSDLSKEFNVDIRTIQRDLNLLASDSEGGFLIDSFNGEYKFREGFSLGKVVVTPEEKFLLMLFYKLFTKIGQPFNTTAKSLLDKILVLSDNSEQGFDDKSIKAIKYEFKNFSSSLALKFKKAEYPQDFIVGVKKKMSEIKANVEELSSKDGVNILSKFTKEYKAGEPVAIIQVPKAYFKGNPLLRYEYCKGEKNLEFLIKISPPNSHGISSMSLFLYIYFNYWGTHTKPRKLVCFDDFVEYLGFPKGSRIFRYEYSWGAEKGSLVTRALLFWKKDIPMLPLKAETGQKVERMGK